MTKIQRKQRARRIVFRIFLLITILSIMITIIFKSDLFKIKDIQVIGNNKLAKEDIIDYSSLHKGENIFRIKSKIVERGIKRLPYIKEVQVKRKLPKTIIINIVEREEKALIKSISTYHVIDIDGYVLKQVESEDENLPALLGLNIDNVKLGISLFNDMETHELIDFLGESNKLKLLNKIRYIDLEELDDINIRLNNGIDIAFGTIDNVKYKLRLLNEILYDIEKRDIKCSKIIMNKGEHPIIITED